MQWIKEVEMVDSVDDLRSSSSIRGISMRNFEVLDNSNERSVWRNKKPKKRTAFFRGRQIAYVIYEYFRVTGANDSVENYADLFTISLRNDDIQEFDSKCDGIFIVYDENPT